ncbi:hypothetical protein [Trueperella sp. LYQ143]|uniref:hypothetical protein n=1 Tax=Trueperella sp. LYQ143 TaxID=3391059 RepID=UPI0039837EC8
MTSVQWTYAIGYWELAVVCAGQEHQNGMSAAKRYGAPRPCVSEQAQMGAQKYLADLMLFGCCECLDRNVTEE